MAPLRKQCHLFKNQSEQETSSLPQKAKSACTFAHGRLRTCSPRSEGAKREAQLSGHLAFSLVKSLKVLAPIWKTVQ